jgi:hypothetical protein
VKPASSVMAPISLRNFRHIIRRKGSRMKLKGGPTGHPPRALSATACPRVPFQRFICRDWEETIGQTGSKNRVGLSKLHRGGMGGALVANLH